MDNKETDFFKTNYVDRVLTQLSEEDRVKYKKIGEYMYGTDMFQDNKKLSNLPSSTEDSVLYIKAAIRSGLHPQDLSKNELQFMNQTVGDDWGDEFGFSSDDVRVP